MDDITKSGVLNTLKNIKDIDFNKDYLTLNSIKNLNVSGDELNLDITIHSSSFKEENKLKIREGLKKEFPSLKKINLNIDVKPVAQQEKKNTILPGVKNTIAVASGKGGVGKSTVAVNIAVALAQEGANVGLIDADIYGPSVPTMLGINEKPKVYQDSVTMKMVPIENYGIKLISMGFLVDDNAPVIWRGPMASGAVKQFMSDVEWGELDYLFFDMPPGTGDIQLTLVQTIPLTGAVIVTTPQEVSLIDARKALKMFTRVNVPILGVVENMSYFIAPDTGKQYDIFGTGGGSKLADELKVPFIGGIPIEPQIRIGGDKGIPIVYDTPDSEHAKTIRTISRNLSQQLHVANLKGNKKIEIILGDD